MKKIILLSALIASLVAQPTQCLTWKHTAFISLLGIGGLYALYMYFNQPKSDTSINNSQNYIATRLGDKNHSNFDNQKLNSKPKNSKKSKNNNLQTVKDLLESNNVSNDINIPETFKNSETEDDSNTLQKKKADEKALDRSQKILNRLQSTKFDIKTATVQEWAEEIKDLIKNPVKIDVFATDNLKFTLTNLENNKDTNFIKQVTEYKFDDEKTLKDIANECTKESLKKQILALYPTNSKI